MFLEDAKIIENINIADNYYLMRVEGIEIPKHSNPGQFFMLQCKDEARVLRRPISLHNIDGNIIEFYYEALGKGTKEFTKLKTGETINIQGPLGTGFDLEIKDKNVVVIGGGMGMAPIKYLIKKLNGTNKVTFIGGGRNSNAIKITDRFNFENLEKKLVTDDGSVGEKGNTVDLLKELLHENKIDIIYTCGPHKMMEAVARVAEENDIRCQISLEERMACGIKACVGCSILTKNGMKKVCHDGPVFESTDIVDVDVVDPNGGCC
ncbi:MAG: dihydroorotate dehydrogenase electron transfer subunit [Fusobacteria bacterium]|nr:MAG: dihydroorotate dehydrogenase electron transfer subunit [Fusobacteriota bacterium]